MICIQVALRRVETILAKSRSCIVVHLITIVHLTGIQHLRTVNRMSDINTLYGTLFVLVGLLPGNRFVPVQTRSDGIALLVFLYLECLVTSVCRVGKTLTDNTVAYPEHKLAVFRVGNLGLIHPKAIYTDITGRETGAPKGVAFFHSDFERTFWHCHHKE